MQNLIKFHQFVYKILSENEMLTITKGHNCVVNLQKWMHNSPNLNPVNVINYAKFGLIRLICSQAIERKRTRNDGITDNLYTSPSLPHPSNHPLHPILRTQGLNYFLTFILSIVREIFGDVVPLALGFTLSRAVGGAPQRFLFHREMNGIFPPIRKQKTA